MNELHNKKAVKFFPFIVAVSLLFISGCFPIRSDTQNASAQLVKNRKKMPVYHDFDDILVPSRYKLNKKSTFVFQTPGLMAGVLVFKGKIKLSADINFFNENMLRDNWNLVTSFKSPRTMLIYNKENRWCVINISIKESKMEIWVAPTIEGFTKKNEPADRPDAVDAQKTGPVPPMENFDSGLFKE